MTALTRTMLLAAALLQAMKHKSVWHDLHGSAATSLVHQELPRTLLGGLPDNAMTRKNRAEHEPKVTTRDVEEAADRLQIPRDTEEGRLARRLLRSLPTIITEFHQLRCAGRERQTPRQELVHHEQFRRAVEVMLGELEDGGWAHRTLSGKAHALAWIRERGSEHATNVAMRGLDEDFAMVRAHLAKWRDSLERSKDVMKRLGLTAATKSAGPSHWLACVSLLVHEMCLSRLKPKVSERRFLDLVFKLANVERGHNVPYHLSEARTTLRHPARREFVIIHLGWLVQELRTRGAGPRVGLGPRQKQDGENRT